MAQKPKFRAFRRFNEPALHAIAGMKYRIDNRVLPLFDGESLPEKIARALGIARVLPLKELFESFEFFERVRRRTRSAHVADLCCGHGLVGVLFAVFEPTVERVTLLDQKRPPSHERLIEAVGVVAPWAPGKVRYEVARLNRAAALLNPGTAILGVHACGVRTDRVLDVALAVRGPLAVMPCCYVQTAKDAPRAVHAALGIELATDIHRTYRLEAAGYRVEWSAIPPAITDKNRILVATLPRGG